jgi:probable rRNA maturation factor
MAVAVDNRQRRVPVDRRRLSHAARRALAAAGRAGGAVDVAIVDDGEIRRLNRAHRGVARRTDVLAFPLEMPAAAGGLVGQIVISAETAARQARHLRVPCALEMDLLVTHGILHLVGYDDRDPVEAALMHRREREILQTARRPLPTRLWTGLLAPPARSARLPEHRRRRAAALGQGAVRPPEPARGRGAPRLRRGAPSAGGHGGRPEPPMR